MPSPMTPASKEHQGNVLPRLAQKMLNSFYSGANAFIFLTNKQSSYVIIIGFELKYYYLTIFSLMNFFKSKHLIAWLKTPQREKPFSFYLHRRTGRPKTLDSKVKLEYRYDIDTALHERSLELETVLSLLFYVFCFFALFSSVVESR